jgi:hypothetical protein
MRQPLFLLLSALLFSSSSLACGGSMSQASGAASFDIDAAKEIDDADVAKAFAAHPQMPGEMRIAYYSFEDGKDADIERMLGSVSGGKSVYRIPKLLVTGERRFHENAPYAKPAQDVGIKKLRLLAARAHADVLLVFDHGWRGGGANGWVALNVLLVPMLITPWLSNETESYADAYVVDVRNGFLYGEVAVDQKGGESAVTIYGKKAEDVAEEQWPKLLTDLHTKLDETIAKSRAQTVSGEAAASGE